MERGVKDWGLKLGWMRVEMAGVVAVGVVAAGVVSVGVVADSPIFLGVAWGLGRDAALIPEAVGAAVLEGFGEEAGDGWASGVGR
jgi:hypothetical protein